MGDSGVVYNMVISIVTGTSIWALQYICLHDDELSLCFSSFFLSLYFFMDLTGPDYTFRPCISHADLVYFLFPLPLSLFHSIIESISLAFLHVLLLKSRHQVSPKDMPFTAAKQQSCFKLTPYLCPSMILFS